MTDLVVLGTTKDPWPYDYVAQGLQFFAMNIERLQSYLPNPFSKTVFHGSSGDFHSGNPLLTLFRIHQDCIAPAREWNSWCEVADQQPGIVEENIQELLCAIDFAIDLVEEDTSVGATLQNANLLSSLSSIQGLARNLLVRLNWFDSDIRPFRSARSMLSEWSYGVADDALPDQTDA